MFTERTSVGLDVHTRSVAAAAIDGAAGELVQARPTPDHGHICRWIGDLPGPVAVTYEAGPTGFGLARSLEADEIRYVIAASSKLQRPSGDRIKTDARNAVHQARLLRLDEITAVVMPSVEQKAARDMVRAWEDYRGDLMRARQIAVLWFLVVRKWNVYLRYAANTMFAVTGGSRDHGETPQMYRDAFQRALPWTTALMAVALAASLTRALL